jgi:hypothetical protein
VRGEQNFMPNLPGDVSIARFASVLSRFGPLETEMLERVCRRFVAWVAWRLFGQHACL